MEKPEINLGFSSNKIVRLPSVRPASPGETAPQVRGYVGCVLQKKISPNDNRPEVKGIVTCAVNIPRWMARAFPDLCRDHQLGKIDLNKYSPEWFNMLVYLPESEFENAQQVDPNLRWVSQIAELSPGLDSLIARGCAQVTPSSPVYRLELSDSGEPKRLLGEGDFYTVVSSVDATDESVALEITIAPITIRNLFEGSSVHLEAFERSRRLCQGDSQAEGPNSPETLNRIRGAQERNRMAVRECDIPLPF